MFGLMVWDRMKWSGVVTNEIPLFGFANNGWNGMEHDGIHSIQIFIFCFIQFGVYEME